MHIHRQSLKVEQENTHTHTISFLSFLEFSHSDHRASDQRRQLQTLKSELFRLKLGWEPRLSLPLSNAYLHIYTHIVYRERERGGKKGTTTSDRAESEACFFVSVCMWCVRARK